MGATSDRGVTESGATTIDDSSFPAFSIKRIAIIGAGPSGLASAKHLLAEGFSSSQIDVYEQQAEVGGVWNYSDATAPPPQSLRVPQTDAHAAPDPPIYPQEDGHPVEEEEEEEEEDEYADYVFDSDEEASTAPGSGACSLPPAPSRRDTKTKTSRPPPVFPSAVYDRLHTNIPHTLMRYSDLGFTATDSDPRATHKDCEIFPPRQVVQEYLVQYARNVRHVVRFSTQVTRISMMVSEYTSPRARINERWNVESTDLLTGVSRTETYDAVVVASGHYAAPYLPEVAPEMSAFAATHPGVISHAKTYRAASAFAGKRVVMVGSGPSAQDIASQLNAVCKPPLIISARSPIPEDTKEFLGVGDKVRMVGPIKQFLVDEKGVEVAVRNMAGQEETTEKITDVDAILFCTGYLYTYPFLPSSSFSSSSSSPPLITDGRRVHGVARHLIHVVHPTLVFPGLPIKIIPFPLAEAQAAVFARLWSNRLPLPTREELTIWEREDEAGKGFEGSRVDGKPFHAFPKGGDALYINALHAWAMQAHGGDDDDDGDSGKAKGNEPPFWGEEELWQRSIYAQAKMQFEKTGHKAKTLRELGFVREHPAP